jgi:hypothetical protein
MKRLARWMKLYLLRSRLARVHRDIEEVEHFRATSQSHLDLLLRAAGNLRAELWYAENPPPPVGTTLRCLNRSR